MKTLIRLSLLSLMLVSLVACGAGSFRVSDTQPIDSQDVTVSMYYIDEEQEGPTYDVSFTVPQTWVGNFEIQSMGNSITITQVREPEDEDLPVQRSDIFTIDALSDTQYWQQIGSYPGLHTNLKYTQDTFFTYHLPIDPHYAGLSPDDYQELADQVPDIIKTFEVTRN